MGGMLRPAPAHTRGGRASCGARRRSPCTGRRPAGRRTKSSSTCRSQLRTQNNKFAIAISSDAAVKGRLINRRPAPRSRELLCTDGVVERVAAHHAHALGRQRHAGTEQSLHLFCVVEERQLAETMTEVSDEAVKRFMNLLRSLRVSASRRSPASTFHTGNLLRLHRSRAGAPSLSAPEEASNGQRLWWRCDAANRSADARPGRPRAHRRAR